MGKMDRTRIVNFLCEEVEGLAAVYLFGSSITSHYSDESDVDIAFLSQEENFKPTKRWSLIGDLSILLGRDVDLVDLRQANTVHQVQIVSNGELIFSADTFNKDRFENRIFQLYLTLNDDRIEVLKGIEDDSQVYG